MVLGGTFDRLHVGHKKLLTAAVAVCDARLVVGVTSTSMLAAKAGAALITPFDVRAAGVVDFVGRIKPGVRVEVAALTDRYGPTVTDATLQAIVVSSETFAAVAVINGIRGEKGFPPLSAVVTQRDNAAIVSSTFLRKGVAQ